MTEITFEGSVHDMARYLTFRAQDLWPQARALCRDRADFFGVSDVYFPSHFYLFARPDLEATSVAILAVHCLAGRATLTVLKEGGSPLGNFASEADAPLERAQGVLDYLADIPVWQVVRADNPVTHVGA